MAGSHDFSVREANWGSMGHGHFVGARRGGAQKMGSAPRFKDGSVVVGGDVGGD